MIRPMPIIAACFTALAMCAGTAAPAAETPPTTPVPKVVELAHEGASPAVAAAHGVVWAAWVRRGRDGENEVVAARLNRSGHALTPVVVSGDDIGVVASAFNRVRVAIGPDGAVYVLYPLRKPWPYTQTGRGVLRLARAADGAHFAAPVDVLAAGGDNASAGMAEIALAPNGDIGIAWLDERNAVARAKLPPEQRPKDRGYTDEDDPPVEVRFALSRDGGAHFGPSVVVAEQASETSPLALVAGDEGFVLAWRAKRNKLKGSYDAVRDVWRAVSADGTSWRAYAKVHNDGYKVGDCPQIAHGLALGGAGRLHVAWYNGSGKRPGVYYAVAPAADAAFSEPRALLGGIGEWIPPANVALAVDGRDRVWVAYEDHRGKTPRVVLRHIGDDNATQTWPGTSPALAAGAHGAILVWKTPDSRIVSVRVED